MGDGDIALTIQYSIGDTYVALLSTVFHELSVLYIELDKQQSIQKLQRYRYVPLWQSVLFHDTSMDR